MKRIIVVLSLLCMTMVSIAQSVSHQKKVAVYVTGTQTGVTKILGDQLVSAFSKSSEYVAIERTNSFLAELSKEQYYQHSGAVDDKEISRLGKQFGVQYVCVADISEAFGKKYVSARLINVENAAVIGTANEYSDLNSMEELMRVSTVLKGQLLGNSTESSSIPAGYVDLGLPSGTLWAKQSSGEYSYSTALEVCKSINAEIPNLEQWMELQTECTWKAKIGGFEVKGKNGNAIFLRSTAGAAGYYWSSTCNLKEKNGDCGRVYELYFVRDGSYEDIRISPNGFPNSPEGLETVKRK